MTVCESCGKKLGFRETRHKIDLGFDRGYLVLCKECYFKKLEKNDLPSNPGFTTKQIKKMFFSLNEKEIPIINIVDVGKGYIHNLFVRVINDGKRYDKKLEGFLKNNFDKNNISIVDIQIKELNETIVDDNLQLYNEYIEYIFTIKFPINF